MSANDTSVRESAAREADPSESLDTSKQAISRADEHKHLPVYEDEGEAEREPTDSEALNALRRQCLGLVPSEPLETSLLPAALWPYRDADKVRTDYPLVLLPKTSDRTLQPLSETLAQSLSGVQAQGRSARILSDNLLRLERLARDQVRDVVGPCSAHSALQKAGRELVTELGLRAKAADELAADMDAMLAQLPEQASLLNLDQDTDLFLLWHAATRELILRRHAFQLEGESLLRGLEQLLAVEQSKSSGARTAEALERSMGAESPVDAGALLGLLGEVRGSTPMTPERRRRIERAGQILREELGATHESVLLLGREPLPDELTRLPGIEVHETPDPIQHADQAFEQRVQRFSQLFRALRVARLELDKPGGGYVPEQHDAWLASLDWQGLTQEELGILPWVVAIEDAASVAREGLGGLSRLLLSGKPVHVMARVEPAESPGATRQDDLSSFRLELGYFGISLREALIVQSTAASPEHLMNGLVRAADATRTSLLLVTQGPPKGTGTELGYWLQMHAALESRAHPLFIYDPQAGSTWARRVDFSANPSPELDWSTYSLERATADGRTETVSEPFTFADFALLHEAFHDHFIQVPDAWSDDESLVNVDTYLRKLGEDASHWVPFVWGVDASGRARKVALTRQLALACRDRLNFWRTLQELAGIKNEYIETAVARVQAETERRAAEERNRLTTEHAAAVERARHDAASDVMERLAAALLNLDPSTLTAAASAPEDKRPELGHPKPAQETNDVEPPEPAAEEAPTPSEDNSGDTIEFDDPWIDSALCTSCNDCMNINPLLFVYNDNKQAQMGDPDAGTYAQLVKAAKQCPARCIHPGKPRNPDEPGLEELMAEAKPFN